MANTILITDAGLAEVVAAEQGGFVLQTSKMERFFSQIGTEVTGSSLWLHSKEGSGLKTRGWLKSAEPVGRS